MNLLDIFPSSLPDIFLFMLACYMFLPQQVKYLLHNNLRHLLHILMAFYLYSPFSYPPLLTKQSWKKAYRYGVGVDNVLLIRVLSRGTIDQSNTRLLRLLLAAGVKEKSELVLS